jgi:hypothetical protein
LVLYVDYSTSRAIYSIATAVLVSCARRCKATDHS